ncbi:hypothetical protein [Maribellus mangrovi]|uniref:hypothetical protein n=1 Tax=Maribellus mangrovi TaxID=3133146 RepID=UPI0030EB8647
MKPGLQHLNVKFSDLITPLLISILVVIGTFPENDWSFSIGIDPPLKWVFNWLFETGLDRGKHIIFPHGPLAFLMYPLSENILLATLVHALLKTILVFGAAGLLSKIKSPVKWLAIAVFAYGIAVFASFNHLLLAGVILLYLNYYEHRKVVFKFSAFFLTALAFYVRAYVAILTGTIFVSFLLYELVKHRNIRATIIDAMSMLGFMLLFQILMYGTPAGFIRYVLGMLHLAQDNSAAAALYPYNNWLFLALALISLTLIFVLNRSHKALFFASIYMLSIFAAWKHGMAREDFYHVKGMLIYLVILFSAFILFERKKWLVTASLAAVAIVLFGLNMKNSRNYRPLEFQVWQGKHLFEFATHFKELKAHAHQKTAENLVSNRLSQAMLDSISDATTDIYPWDYSVAAINNLNWQPRPVIQSYAAYTSWLDQQNTEHWASESAPKFVIWDKQKITADINNGDFNSIDSRYLLNDEPQSLLAMLNQYQPCCSDEKFLLLKKRASALIFQKNELKETETTWNTWIDVPNNASGLLRCKLRFNKSLIQQLKSFFYKDEQVWIYLKLTNGMIHKYRIVPKNAADGLWINPYLFDFKHSFQVQQIMLKASNRKILATNLKLEWEGVNCDESPDVFTDFFKIRNSSDTLIFESVNTFENLQTEDWQKLTDEQLTKNAWSGEHAHQLIDNAYSCTFRLELDRIPKKNVVIKVDAWVLVPGYKGQSNISLVIDFKAENGRNIYQSKNIEQQIIDEKGWNHVLSSIDIDNVKPGSRLTVYFWSPDKEPVYIDDFRVRLSSSSSH